MIRSLLFLISIIISSSSAMAETFNHSDWDQLLGQHVSTLRDGKASLVDYTGISREHERLNGYLDRMSKVSQVDFDQWPREDQLAFLINAYNAWTIQLTLTAYPGITSIKQLGSLFTSPWQKEFIPLLGKNRSLDDIEHHLIRGSDRYNDPRIHFAVNCASIDCPALRPEAYSGDRLNRQLDEQMSNFLTDRTRNRLEGGELKVSPIFKWYREDFEKGWRDLHSLSEFFSWYASDLGMSESDVQSLQIGRINIEFLDYDWSLNAKQS